MVPHQKYRKTWHIEELKGEENIKTKELLDNLISKVDADDKKDNRSVSRRYNKMIWYFYMSLIMRY